MSADQNNIARFHNLEGLWDRVAVWSRRTFGDDDFRGPDGPLAHMAKEVAELRETPQCLKEYSDVLILWCDAARRAGYDLWTLLEAAHMKQSENESRQWQKPDAEGVCLHVRGESEPPK